jgi:methionine--tRNA ligase beta chain
MVSFDEFKKLDMRVGVVLEAKRVEGTDKLVLLDVDIGERRRLVAGIGHVYPPEELVGKNVIVLANLEPKEIRGITSHGMILAAQNEKLVILTTDKDIAPGARVV